MSIYLTFKTHHLIYIYYLPSRELSPWIIQKREGTSCFEYLFPSSDLTKYTAENIKCNEFLDYNKIRIDYETPHVLNYMEQQHIEVYIY